MTLDKILNLSEPHFFFFILSFPKTCIKSLLFWVLESETRKTRWPLWVSAVVCASDWGVRDPATGYFCQLRVIWFAPVQSRAALSLDPCCSEGLEDWQASNVPCTSGRHFPTGNLLLLAQLLNCLTPLGPMGWEGLPVHLYLAHLSWLSFNFVFQLWRKTSIWMAVIGNLIIFWCLLWCLEIPLRMVYIFSAFPHSVLKLCAKNSAWILFSPFLSFFFLKAQSKLTLKLCFLFSQVSVPGPYFLLLFLLPPCSLLLFFQVILEIKKMGE